MRKTRPCPICGEKIDGGVEWAISDGPRLPMPFYEPPKIMAFVCHGCEATGTIIANVVGVVPDNTED